MFEKRPRANRFLAPSIALGALVLLVDAQPQTGGAWSGVTLLESNLMSASPPDVPIVACDSVGHAVAVWTSPSLGVAFTERHPGADWTNADSILPGVVGDFPQAAIGASGVVAASWVIPGQKYVPPKLVVSVRPVGGSFTTPFELASGIYVFDSKLAVAANGSVTIVWGDSGTIRAATRTVGGAWSNAVALSPIGVSANLGDLAMNDAGAAVAVWQETPAGGSGPSAIGAAHRAGRSSAVWGASQIVSAGTGLQTWNPKPGIDSAGDVAVGYLDGNTMMLVRKSASGNWGTPVAVSSANDAVYYPELAMDSNGNIVAAWQSLDSGNHGSISKRSIPFVGPWSAVSLLSTVNEDASWPMLSIARNGSVACITWVDNSTNAARASIGRLRGAWTTWGIGAGWWNTPVPVAAGSLAVSAVWAAPTFNPNVTNRVANVYTP